jgi:hypothetical protein
MKNLLLILILNLTLNSCVKEKNCASFKTGTFQYSDQLYSDLKVIRTDSTQTEINMKNGLEMHSSIKWINDCNYVLTITKVLNADLENVIGKIIEVEIVETKSDSYKLKSKSDDGNLELELKRIN